MASQAYTTSFYHTEPFTAGEKLQLSMFISDQTWVYAIFGASFKKVVELCEVNMNEDTIRSYSQAERVDYLIHNHGLHQKSFEKVLVAVLNNRFTLVPDAFAGEGTTKALLEFASGGAAIKTSASHHLNGMEFGFSVADDLSAVLERHFPNVSIRHAGAVSVQLLQVNHSLREANLFMSLHGEQLELLARNAGGLLFYNVFTVNSEEDVLYYLLFMMEQYQLNPLLSKLVIACEKAVNDDLFKSIRKYIKSVNFAVGDPRLQVSGAIATLPQHYYFTLLNQSLCEL